MQFDSLAKIVRKDSLLKMSSNFQNTFSTSTLGTPMIATEHNFFSMQNKAPNLAQICNELKQLNKILRKSDAIADDE